MTLSPSSIMLKSVMALPVKRSRRLRSLICSRSAFSLLRRLSAGSTGAFIRPAPDRNWYLTPLFEAEDFDADGFDVLVHIGLFARDTHGAHRGMREQRACNVVDQRFLQIDVAGVEAAADRGSHEIVVDNLVDVIFLWCRKRQRNEQVDVQHHSLRARQFRCMNADVRAHHDLTHENTPAVGKRRMQQGAHDWPPSGSVMNITSRVLGTRCWPPSTSSVVPVTAPAFA